MADFLKKLVEKIPLNGGKAYIGGFGLIVWGVLGLFGIVEGGDSIMLISNGLGLIGIRHAMSKSGFEALMQIFPQVVLIIQEIRKRQVNPDEPVVTPDVPVTPPAPQPQQYQQPYTPQPYPPQQPYVQPQGGTGQPPTQNPNQTG